MSRPAPFTFASGARLRPLAYRIVDGVRRVRLYDPLQGSWGWHESLDAIPARTMAHLWPEEREQVRRLIAKEVQQ